MSRIPHYQLLLFGLVSLWLNMFGIGFFLLRIVNQEIYDQGTNTDPRERIPLSIARGMAHFSIVLFFLSWLGFVVLLTHPREQ